jgi:TolB protein
MKRHVRLAAVALIAIVMALVPSAPATATVPGDNGRLTFMRQDSGGFWQVWVAHADLTHPRQLTHGTANSGWPVWSPNGRKIAFDSDRGDRDPSDPVAINDVFTMDADGTAVRNLTGSRGFSGDAAWSPDGSSIAFDSDGGGYPGRQGIYVMKADGTSVRRVTRPPASATNDLAPRFAPDGHRLVFTRFNGDTDFGNSALLTVEPDGTGLRQITPFGVGAGDADWSPDGSRIVFEAYPTPGSTGQIRVVRADGTHSRTLTDGFSADPVWSPDGATLLFLAGEPRNGGFVLGLATMKPDGSGRHFLSRTPMVEHQPDWQSTRRY